MSHKSNPLKPCTPITFPTLSLFEKPTTFPISSLLLCLSRSYLYPSRNPLGWSLKLIKLGLTFETHAGSWQNTKKSGPWAHMCVGSTQVHRVHAGVWPHVLLHIFMPLQNLHSLIRTPNSAFLDSMKSSLSQESIHTKNYSIICHFSGLKCNKTELVRCCCSTIASLFLFQLPECVSPLSGSRFK